MVSLAILKLGFQEDFTESSVQFRNVLNLSFIFNTIEGFLPTICWKKNIDD